MFVFLGLEGHAELSPPPSRARPPSHCKISRPKSLGFCYFFLPEAKLVFLLQSLGPSGPKSEHKSEDEFPPSQTQCAPGAPPQATVLDGFGGFFPRLINDSLEKQTWQHPFGGFPFPALH